MGWRGIPVEFPSQFLENFAYEKKYKKVAYHYKTDKPIDGELLDKDLRIEKISIRALDLIPARIEGPPLIWRTTLHNKNTGFQGGEEGGKSPPRPQKGRGASTPSKKPQKFKRIPKRGVAPICWGGPLRGNKPINGARG